jgi:hypothetical protein
MAKRFLDLRNRQIREGKLNKGFPGKDFSSQAFLSDRAIVVFRISKSQAQGELAVIEGKFNYPGSRATGSLSGYMSASVFTEEERNGEPPALSAGGFAWRHAAPLGSDVEISDLYSSAVSQNAARVQLAPVSINQNRAGITSDIRSSISRGLGRKFAKKHGGIATDWISDPYSFSIRDTPSIGSRSRAQDRKSLFDLTSPIETIGGGDGSRSSGGGSSPPTLHATPGNPAHSPELTAMNRQTRKTSIIRIYANFSRGRLELRQVIFISKKRDSITGTDQGEIIAGGGGKNRLTGGGGPDAFLFETPGRFGEKTADRITDFNSAEGDKIAISRDAFEGVDRVRFKVVSGKRDARKAGRSNKNFVYDDKSGMLYYDANGNKKGWGDGGAFAKLLGVPDIERSDFAIL